MIDETGNKVSVFINNKNFQLADDITCHLLSETNAVFIATLRKVMYFRLCEGFESPPGLDSEESILTNRRTNTTAATVKCNDGVKKFYSVSCASFLEPQNHSSAKVV